LFKTIDPLFQGQNIRLIF